MRVLFPKILDAFNLRRKVADKNAAEASTVFSHEDVAYILKAIEERIGVIGSNDATSLDYRIRQLEEATPTVVATSPAGSTGVTGEEVFNETPSGAINGSNAIFTTAYAFATGATRVYLNGLRMTLGDDYTETGTTTISFATAPISGDTLRIDYTKA